jgi:Cof subfamily protein (haloacid dehalogenase superfamily)
MRKYKLIAFDIDGTILGANNAVCEELKTVVSRLKIMGYLFTLVTARFPLAALDIAKQLDIDCNEGIVTLNGGYITNKKHDELYSKTFSTSAFIEKLESIDESIVINYYKGFHWVINKHTKYTEVELGFMESNHFPAIGCINEVNKITLMGDNINLIEAKKILSQDSSLLVSFSHPHYLEVTTTSISKYHGLSHYVNKLKIDLSEVIAFGDGENDIPMLKNVGLGIAMGNASDHVKKEALDVAGHHLEAGVAIYLENLLQKGIL